MKQLYHKDVKANFVEVGNYVEGYASVFDNIDHAGEIVERTAWTKTLDPKNRKSQPKFLWQHKSDSPIGVIEETRVDSHGLWFRARFDDTTAGQDARKALLNGSVDSFSIGYRVILAKARKVGERVVKSLIELALHEISIVTFPCNELAVLTAVKSVADEGEKLNDEDAAVLARIAKMMLAAQAAAPTDEDAPEEPAEGEEEADADEDTPEEDKPSEDEAKPGESEDENEHDKKALKLASDIVLGMKLDVLLSQLRA